MTMRGRGLEMKSGTYPKGARVFRKGVERLQGGVSPEGGHSQGLHPTTSGTRELPLGITPA